MVQTQKAGDDKLLSLVHKNMGRVYMDQRRWHAAIRFFVLSKQSEALVECFFELNDYEDMEELMDALPEGDPILADIARKMESVGLCHSAVKGFVKVGQARYYTASEHSKSHVFVSVLKQAPAQQHAQ